MTSICPNADGLPYMSGDDSNGADEAVGVDAAHAEAVPRGSTSAVVPADRATGHLLSTLPAMRAIARLTR